MHFQAFDCHGNPGAVQSTAPDAAAVHPSSVVDVYAVDVHGSCLNGAYHHDRSYAVVRFRNGQEIPFDS